MFFLLFFSIKVIVFLEWSVIVGIEQTKQGGLVYESF